VKKEILILMVLSVFLISACDVYNTLYIKEAQGDTVEVPDSDIMVEGSDKVFRVEGEQDEENLAKTVYAAAEAIEHDPFKVGENPLGPFEKGEELGFTLGDWLAATGSGTYEVDDGEAELDLEFENLVPDAVYTIWCSRISFPPNVNIVDRPCGAEDGSENVFETDEEGNANYNLELEPLEQSTEETATIIALAYHSDGETYGESAGDFGLNSHVQIFYLIPVPEDEEESFEVEMEFVNHIDAELLEQDVFIEMEEVMEKEVETVEEEIDIEIVEEDEEVPEDAIVLIVEETKLVSLVPKAEDPDQDLLIFTFTSPLDDDGEWQTTYGDAGEYTVTVTASDGELTASKEILIIINRKEEAPVFDSFNPKEIAVTIDETDSVIFEVDASDLNDDELTYSWKLDGIEIEDKDNFEYQTTYDDSGSHTVKISISDGLFDSEKIWSVTVNNLNREPVLSDVEDIEVEETDIVVIELEATDDDGDELSYSVDDERFVQDENSFTWETTYDDAGEHSVTVTVSDGVDTTSQEVTITIENVNRAPVILDIVQK